MLSLTQTTDDGPIAGIHLSMPATVARICVLAVLLSASTAASARAYYNREFDGLIARCTTVNLVTLPEASRARYDVTGGPDEGLLSCVVQQADPDGEPRNVRAQVQARYTPLGQTPRSVDLREVREGNLVTYLGTYPVESAQPLQFTVTVQVDGVGTVELDFDDQNPRI